MNDNNYLISVIVPVYNVEKYLNKCVHSILEQTYRNLEIILVDDGSTDNSGVLCDELSKSDKRIAVFHQKNGGLSSARNLGIKNSHGQMLSFIDSDDFIERDMLEVLYSHLMNYEADISVCGYTMLYPDKERIICNGMEVKVYDKLEALKNMFLVNDIGFISCNKLFKKSLFDNITFPIGKHFEDINTIGKVISKAEKVIYDPISKYNYIQRNDSINGNNFQKRKFDKKIYDLYFASMDVYNFIEKNYPSILYEASIGCINYNLRVINQLIVFKIKDEKVYQKTKKLIKSNLKKIINDSKISIFRKIQYILYCYGYFIYRIIIRIMK